jgi:hypothetical protein
MNKNTKYQYRSVINEQYISLSVNTQLKTKYHYQSLHIKQ